jgi:hypothetical protein
MSTLTLTIARSMVRDAISEESTTILSDTELGNIINDGYKEVCIIGLAYEATKTFDLTEGCHIYTIPETTQVSAIVNYVEINSRGILEQFPTQFGHNGEVTAGKGVPIGWFQWGNLIVIDPPPNATYAGASYHTVTLYCSCYPAAICTTTFESLPLEFQESIVEFGIAFSLFKLKRWGDAAIAYNKYIGNLQRKRFDYIEKLAEERTMTEIQRNTVRTMGE